MPLEISFKKYNSDLSCCDLAACLLCSSQERRPGSLSYKLYKSLQTNIHITFGFHHNFWLIRPHFPSGFSLVCCGRLLLDIIFFKISYEILHLKLVGELATLYEKRTIYITKPSCKEISDELWRSGFTNADRYNSVKILIMEVFMACSFIDCWSHREKVLTKTLLRVPFSVIGQCFLVQNSYWLQGKCARINWSLAASGRILQNHIRLPGVQQKVLIHYYTVISWHNPLWRDDTKKAASPEELCLLRLLPNPRIPEQENNTYLTLEQKMFNHNLLNSSINQTVY